MSAGLVPADERFKFSDQPVIFFSTGARLPPTMSMRFPTAARPATRSEAIVQGFLELWNGCIAILVVQSIATAEVDLGQFDEAYIRDLKISFRKPDAASGCSTAPAISDSELCDHNALDGKLARILSSSVLARISMRGSRRYAR